MQPCSSRILPSVAGPVERFVQQQLLLAVLVVLWTIRIGEQYGSIITTTDFYFREGERTDSLACYTAGQIQER